MSEASIPVDPKLISETEADESPATRRTFLAAGSIAGFAYVAALGYPIYRYLASPVEQQAALNLSYTQISAPVDGTIGARSLRVGQFVQAGTQLMAVVPLDAVYVVANFKETQLTHVRDGQPVEIQIDSFHGTRLRGHVDSLSPASGLEFALLPPDNATGNFTKIVQRVPVKIVLDDHRLTGLLRPGMSAEPVINTKATVLAEQEPNSKPVSHLALARLHGG